MARQHNALTSIYSTLAPINQVRELLASEADIDAIADFDAKAQAARKLSDRDGKNSDHRNYFGELAIWSSRRLGEMIKEGQDEGWIATHGKRPDETGHDVQFMTVDDVAPNHKYASRCKQLANVGEGIIKDYVQTTKQSAGEISKSGCLSAAKNQDALVKSKPKRIRKESLGVHHCSLTDLDVPDESVDLVFTDPPYARKTLHLYQDLFDLSWNALVPGGSVMCYCGHVLIADIVDMAKSVGLRWYWVCACLHHKKAAMARQGIRAGWKPILWFTKGERYDVKQFVQDCVLEPPEKKDHAWQQSVAEAQRYIECLSRPNHVILDPFCGSGTTCIAAKLSGRKWISCDIDADAVNVARERVAECE